MYHRITHIDLHQCIKFGVASSTFPGTGGPLSNKAFFGPGAYSLHPTRTATRKAYTLGQHTCELQVWDRWCTSFCRQGRQKNKKMQNTCTCAARRPINPRPHLLFHQTRTHLGVPPRHLAPECASLRELRDKDQRIA